ncbi:LysR family transcriptional regulator [Ralstonia insidiosa]|jgi:DNA-binding transcriptional LysR family regulator|uniref:LysR family transcriptional regulator n=1 Tax=Ralstonia TaxID=48736 RepID=UPI0006648CCF|nr:LysR family transcriptional regulator [Ralstonia insidiosa]KMW47513.1 LysR family transcriptional regulator [Ralstonia sp. MD27]MBX3773771.1 LysR family transcriptional regulator [Ralstonia pickettii]NOZ17038.1 LysR family transcriptional regulator [Betaproteobacteria bacterium]MBA9857446.1 LysR family transcriptional regulator [Ralstonia insidiosa]MBA9870776.1 LysR family transcriptional regulator [Ralstonia insidiosa]
MANPLQRIDLNLLVTLHALLNEQHISRAAVRLHKSQPAVSHALAHLRELFGDPLLVRRGGKLALTARARELSQPLEDVLDQLGALLAPPAFDAAAAQRVFRLVMSDYGARTVLPELIRRLRAEAPGIDLVVTQSTRELMPQQVLDGEVDLALGVFPSPPPELLAEALFTDTFACAADATTLPTSGALTLKSWLTRPHALVAMRGGVDNEIDRALARLGHTRRIAITLPHWGVANDLIAGTDLVLTVARRNLDRLGGDARLGVFAAPFPIEPFTFGHLWHPRRQNDPAHQWLRRAIAEVVQTP